MWLGNNSAVSRREVHVDILSDYEVAYTLPSTPLEIVEGYLFDGKRWFAMKETWDGWISIE